MKAVIQRVNKASVMIAEQTVAQIKEGLLILLGIEDRDTIEDISWLSSKIINLRIFNDENGTMNISLKDKNADILVVSQFTLYASTKKGNRPSYTKASKPDTAIPLYQKMIHQLQNDLGKSIHTGVFGANMKIDSINDGPVTIVIDTQQKE